MAGIYPETSGSERVAHTRRIFRKTRQAKGTASAENLRWGYLAHWGAARRPVCWSRVCQGRVGETGTEM